jgi:hypothetical protein
MPPSFPRPRQRALLGPWEATLGPLATGDVSIYLARKSDRAESHSPRGRLVPLSHHRSLMPLGDFDAADRRLTK